MTILVSDTSVLIDLERGDLLDSCFRLPHEFAVTDLLYARELADHGGPALRELGLRVEELDGQEVSAAQAVLGNTPSCRYQTPLHMRLPQAESGRCSQGRRT